MQTEMLFSGIFQSHWWPGGTLTDQKVEFDRPGERSADVSTTWAVVIFRVNVSCITSVDGIILWLLIWLVNYVAMLLVVCQLSSDVIGYEDS